MGTSHDPPNSMHGFSPYSTGSPGQPQFTKCRSPELETFSCYWTVGDYQDLKIPGSVQVFYARRWRLHALLTFLHYFVSVNGMEKRSGVIQIRSERMWACLCTYAHVQLGLSNTGAEDISGTSLMQRFKSAKEMKWEELRTNEGHLWRQRKLKVRCPALMLTSLRIRRACTDGVRLKTWEGDTGRGHSDTQRQHQCLEATEEHWILPCVLKNLHLFSTEQTIVLN